MLIIITRGLQYLRTTNILKETRTSINASVKLYRSQMHLIKLVCILKKRNKYPIIRTMHFDPDTLAHTLDN